MQKLYGDAAKHFGSTWISTSLMSMDAIFTMFTLTWLNSLVLDYYVWFYANRSGWNLSLKNDCLKGYLVQKIIHESVPVNAFRPDSLCALDNATLMVNHCGIHSKPFVILCIFWFWCTTSKACPWAFWNVVMMLVSWLAETWFGVMINICSFHQSNLLIHMIFQLNSVQLFWWFFFYLKQCWSYARLNWKRKDITTPMYF